MNAAVPGDPSKNFPVAAILLASGFSKRFGEQNKLLFPFRGKPLARHTLELAVKIDFSGGIFFVTASCEVTSIAADLEAVKVVSNAAPEKGQRESVRLGVEAVGRDVGYYFFFPCDQPFLDVETVRRILDAREHGCIVEPRFRSKPRTPRLPGSPCIFSAVFRDELLSLAEGETPRQIKRRHPEALRGVDISNPLTLEDIDDEKTLKRLLPCGDCGD